MSFDHSHSPWDCYYSNARACAWTSLLPYPFPQRYRHPLLILDLGAIGVGQSSRSFESCTTNWSRGNDSCSRSLAWIPVDTKYHMHDRKKMYFFLTKNNNNLHNLHNRTRNCDFASGWHTWLFRPGVNGSTWRNLCYD